MDDPRKHLPSASGLERLALCPGSFALERNCPPEPESEDAASGTRIHAALARFYQTNRDIEPGTLTDVEWETYDMCVRIVDNLGMTWLAEDPQPEQFVEQREWLHGNGAKIFSGQYDLLVIQGWRGLCIDYKTGRGDQTEAVSNYQLRGLATVVAENHPELAEITVAIVQPWVTTKPQMCVYGIEDLALARAEVLGVLARGKDSEDRVPGEKQCKFCRAKAVCPEMRKQVQTVASLALHTIEVDDLPWLLALCGPVLKAVACIRALAKDVLKNDVDAIPGWTLERMEGDREIKDAQAAYSRLADVMSPEDFAACCRVGVTKLEPAFRKCSGLKGKAASADLARRLEGVMVREKAEDREPQLARAKPALAAV